MYTSLSSMRDATKPSHRSWWSKAKHVHWSIHTALLICLAAAVGVSMGWTFRTRSVDSAPSSLYQGRRISLELTILNVDPVTQGGSFVIDWDIRDDTCFHPNNAVLINGTLQTVSYPCSAVNIYMDLNLFAGPTTTSSGASTIIPTVPIFQWVPETYNHSTLASSPVFQTNLAIWTRFANLRDSLVNYPFDKYSAEIFMFARTNDTGEVVGVEVTSTDGTAFGFGTFIVPFNEPSELDSVDDQDPSPLTSGSLDLYLIINRTVLVKAYVMVLIIAMWLITLILLAIAAKAVLFGFEIDNTILVVPVATLFAFTSLRSSMPGSPAGFGAYIDFVGTLPSLALLVVVVSTVGIYGDSYSTAPR